MTAAVACKRCGSPDGDLPARGRWAGVCPGCRTIERPATRVIGAAENECRDPLLAQQRTRLSRTVKLLEPAAKRLEGAVGNRERARAETNTALAEFNEALRAVRAAAQSLLNQHVAREAIAAELDRDDERRNGGAL